LRFHPAPQREWHVQLNDLIDCPDQWSLSRYITFRIEQGIGSGTTLEDYNQSYAEPDEVVSQRE
jgi:hypothetical protein